MERKWPQSSPPTPNGVKTNRTKKSLPGPTTPSKVLTSAMVTLCRRYLFIDTSTKIGAYMLVVILGSLFSDIFPLPKTYLANKKSILNKILVKFGWGLTLILLGGFITLSSYIRSGANWSYVKKQLLRLAVGTAIWYSCTSIFDYILHTTGRCTLEGHHSKGACYRSGNIWLGFDTSGHCFILVYSLLLISEEVKMYRGWDRLKQLLQEPDQTGRLSKEQKSRMLQSYESFDSYLKISVVWLTCLQLLWEVMLLITTLYHHTILEKVAGSFVAVLVWFATYQVWYNMKMSPGLPGEGSVNLNVNILT